MRSFNMNKWKMICTYAHTYASNRGRKIKQTVLINNYMYIQKLVNLIIDHFLCNNNEIIMKLLTSS